MGLGFSGDERVRFLEARVALLQRELRACMAAGAQAGAARADACAGRLAAAERARDAAVAVARDGRAGREAAEAAAAAARADGDAARTALARCEALRDRLATALAADRAGAPAAATAPPPDPPPAAGAAATDGGAAFERAAVLLQATAARQALGGHVVCATRRAPALAWAAPDPTDPARRVRLRPPANGAAALRTGGVPGGPGPDTLALRVAFGGARAAAAVDAPPAFVLWAHGADGAPLGRLAVDAPTGAVVLDEGAGPAEGRHLWSLATPDRWRPPDDDAAAAAAGAAPPAPAVALWSWAAAGPRPALVVVPDGAGGATATPAAAAGDGAPWSWELGADPPRAAAGPPGPDVGGLVVGARR